MRPRHQMKAIGACAQGSVIKDSVRFCAAGSTSLLQQRRRARQCKPLFGLAARRSRTSAKPAARVDGANLQRT